MFDIGDTLQSKVCPTMAGAIIKLDKNRAVLFPVKFNYFNSKWNTILMYTKYYLVQTN